MHSITNKLIRDAVEYLLGGRYEKPEEKQVTQFSTVGIRNATPGKRTVAAVSPVVQTDY